MEKSDEKAAASLNAHLQEWQRIAERIGTQIGPVALAMPAAIQQSFESIRAVQETFRSARESILAAQNQWAEIVKSIEIPNFEALRIELPNLSDLTTQAMALQDSLQKLIAPAFANFKKSFQDLPPRIQEALLLLGAHGWYFDLDLVLPKLWNLREALLDGNVEEAEAALVDYYEGRANEIEKSLTEMLPLRAHLIKAAFTAHRRQEYELSIPVFLAQTDGICKELTKQYLFIKRDKKPQTATYVEEIALDTFRASLLSPLAQTLPISASERERTDANKALNRHAVLHGESLNYGNKTNSLKAISLINYVAHVLKMCAAADNRPS
jgi:hypothetical protein